MSLPQTPFTLIFDMDGVIVDSNPYHKQAWTLFCQGVKNTITNEEMQTHIFGKTNEDALTYLYGDTLSPEQIMQLAREKEVLYRQLFHPHIKAPNGLTDFLKQCNHHGVYPSIATSAPPDNVDFVLDSLQLRSYFSLIVDETMVKKGKPDPEIYLLTAQKLGIAPSNCVVFEDSLSGTVAARSAGMNVIGVTTTHTRQELAPYVDACIDDFAWLAQNLLRIEELLKQPV